MTTYQEGPRSTSGPISRRVVDCEILRVEVIVCGRVVWILIVRYSDSGEPSVRGSRGACLTEIIFVLFGLHLNQATVDFCFFGPSFAHYCGGPYVQNTGCVHREGLRYRAIVEEWLRNELKTIKDLYRALKPKEENHEPETG